MARIIDLGEAQAIADSDPMWDARGKAIQAYATLEQSLCQLFVALGNIPKDVAPVIFFRITSQDVRNKILEKLARIRHGDKYNLFFNSLFKQLHTVDGDRNGIVHWHAVQTVGANEAGQTTVAMSLKPPASLNVARMEDFANAPEFTTQLLIEFINKCVFYSRLMNMFWMVTSGVADATPGFDKQRWLDTFQQPIVYPPPPTHPFRT